MIGRRVGGRYEIIKYIGGGGMSRVYHAHDIILDRDVAIKVLNYDFSNEEELKRRFMREAQSATSLTHPHIVDIFDVGEDEELHYLVMEYIDGQTLKEYIVSNGPQTPEQALPIMRQLVSAISNAHYNGIVHRDIKPQNILMDNEGNVKITDFGIAMALSATAHTKTNSVLGTVHYLSPEQARGGMATKKSDIYSVGIVFYELLTGKLPFSGESAVSIALKHLQEETPSIRAQFPHIPQSVENVILKATAKDSAARYRSADEMLDDLSTVLSPERANDEKFSIVYDDEMTRAIPVITDAPKFKNIEETKKHEPVQVEPKPVTASGKKRKKWPFIIGGLVILIIAALLILPDLLGLKKVEVPDVAGRDEVEAIDLLEEEGFKVGERTEENSDEFEDGQVIKTVPEANKKRKKGTEIKLYVSIGKEKFELKNYIGSDIAATLRNLEKYDFRPIKVVEKFDEESPGTIIGQNIEEGKEVIPSETDLQFTVSKGKEVQLLDSLSGYDEEQLAQYERTSGIDIIIVKKEHSQTVKAGEVISQKPSAGSNIEKGETVEVVLSKGPPQKPVKHLIQTVTIEYAEDLPLMNGDNEDDEQVVPERTPQRIRIFVQDRNHTLADPVDEFYITETTVKRFTVELEEGGRGMYRIMRDSTEIAVKNLNYDDTP